MVQTSLHTVKAIQATIEDNEGVQQEKRSEECDAHNWDSRLEELE